MLFLQPWETYQNQRKGRSLSQTTTACHDALGQTVVLRNVRRFVVVDEGHKRGLVGGVGAAAGSVCHVFDKLSSLNLRVCILILIICILSLIGMILEMCTFDDS